MGLAVIDIVVRRNSSGNDCLSKSPGTLDDDGLCSGNRVGGEHNACLLGEDELLNNNCNVDGAVIESVLCAVINCTGSV